MKVSRAFTIDYELIEKLKQEDNASQLVNNIITDYYNGLAKKDVSKLIDEKKKELDYLEKAKADQELDKQLETKKELDDEELKVKIDHSPNEDYAKELHRKIKSVQLWGDFTEEQAREIAVAYLKNGEVMGMKEYLVKLGIKVK